MTLFLNYFSIFFKTGHLLFKAKHAVEIFALIIILFAGFGIVGIRMVAIEELHDMEAAFVDIEMDI